MKKIVSILLMTAVLSGCVAGCKKLESDPTLSESTTTITTTSEETTTTETTIPIIQASPEYVEDVKKYIDLVNNGFPKMGDNVKVDTFNYIKTTLQNEDCQLQISEKSHIISFNFNFDENSTKPILGRVEYVGYILNENSEVTGNQENAEKKYALGTVYINVYSKEEAEKLFADACEYTKTLNTGVIEASDNETFKDYVVFDDETKITWKSVVELDYPQSEDGYYTLRIAFYKNV